MRKAKHTSLSMSQRTPKPKPKKAGAAPKKKAGKPKPERRPKPEPEAVPVEPFAPAEEAAEQADAPQEPAEAAEQPDAPQEQAVEAVEKPAVAVKPQTCAACGRPGHNKRGCEASEEVRLQQSFRSSVPKCEGEQ